MPATPVADAVAAYARRSAAVGFVEGFAQATFVVGVTAAVVLLAMHLAGTPLRPHPAWLAAMGPGLAWAAWRARARRVPTVVAAGELDRRLAAGGLLLTAHELGDLGPEWQERLQPRLGALAAALPALPWQRFWPGPALAVVLAVLLASLGPTRVGPAVQPDGAFAARLADAQTLLQAARLAGTMAPELVGELAQKLEQLAPLAGDAADAWRELDGVLARIAREQLLARLDGERGPNGAGGAAAALAQVQTLARSLLGDLTMSAVGKQLVESMVGSVGGGDLVRQFADPTRMGELAERFGGVAEDLLRRAAAAGLGPRELQQIGAFAESLRDQAAGLRTGGRQGAAAGTGSADTAVRGGAPGRGPGRVARQWSEPVAGAAEQALPLPNGGAGAQAWVPVGTGLGAPEVAPVAGTASGQAPAAGRGGASWQLQLAPHHREVVQKFFAGAPAQGPGEGK